MFNQRPRRALLVLLCGVLLGSVQVVLTPPAAHAGQLGLVVKVQGAGSVRIVEGSVEDGAPTTCDHTDNQDHNAVQTCPRWRNSEILEAWLWLRAEGADQPAGNWGSGIWSGCDKTRFVTSTQVECGVHSGAFSSDEKVVSVHFWDFGVPVVSPITQTWSTTQERTATYSFSANEGRTQCRFDGIGQFVDCASGIQHTWPAEGDRHTVDVQATDTAGRVGRRSMQVVMVDTKITAGPASSVASRRAELSLSTRYGNTFRCSVDGTPWAACGSGPTAALVLDDLADGPHRVAVRAAFGDEVDPIPAWWEWTVDATAPETGIDVRRVEGDEAEIGYSSTEAGTFECRHTVGSGNADWAACDAAGTSLTDLGAGRHTFAVRAVDSVGNVDPTPAEHAWVVTGSGHPTGPTEPTGPVQPPAPAAPGSTRRARVVRVLDGDTVVARVTGARRPVKVDLAGLADPRRTCTGRAARRALARALRPGTSMTLTATSRSRLTGASPWRVLSGRKDLALAQLRAGRARLAKAEAPAAQRASYARAQRDARRHHRGLWSC